MFINPLRIYKRAYRFMDMPVIDGDCGRLCGRLCCTPRPDWGIYLLPDEEIMLHRGAFHMEKHRRRLYDLPRAIPYLYFVSCNGMCFNGSAAARRRRPIQCRTYPLMPVISGGHLMLVKNPLGGCPLAVRQLDPDFINRCFKAWKLLMQIPPVKRLVQYGLIPQPPK